MLPNLPPPDLHQAIRALLLAARAATQGKMGVSFHVGSQCMRPTAYQAAMAQASRAIVRAGVMVDIVDVGGGFPSVYPGMVPPDMSDYVDSIQRGFADMMVHEETELWCEPGRALVAEAQSILTKVELRKNDALYLNDGSYGNLFDAAHVKWPFPVKLYRGEGEGAHEVEGPLKPFRFYGPTCDSMDHMPGPFWLPEDIREGDYIEIGMLGAYGVAMTTRFNGYGDAETVVVGVRAGRSHHPPATGKPGGRTQGRPSVASQGPGRQEPPQAVKPTHCSVTSAAGRSVPVALYQWTGVTL